jgi:hypothetical protein
MRGTTAPYVHLVSPESPPKTPSEGDKIVLGGSQPLGTTIAHVYVSGYQDGLNWKLLLNGRTI